VPPEVLQRLAEAEIVVLESNHDPDLLVASGRPQPLVNRIAGPFGHLSNGAAAEAVAALLNRAEPGQVRTIVLAHLSRDCNDRSIALHCTRHALKGFDGPRPQVAAADQDAPLTVALPAT